MEDDILVPNPLPNLSNYIIINAAKNMNLQNVPVMQTLWSSLLNGELKLKIVKVVGPIKFEVL